MGIYRLKRCKSCNYKKREAKPGKIGRCPKCQGAMYYSDNWFFSCRLKGRRIEKSAGPDKKIAQELEWKARLEISQGKMAAPMSWDKSIERIEKTYRKLSPATVAMYKGALKHLTPFFKGIELFDITEQLLEDYKDMRLSQDISGATFNRERTTLKRLFSLSGVAWNFRKNVFEVEREIVRTAFLDPDEQRRLLEACRKTDYLYTAILIALNTGLRKSALFGLQFRDIDFKKNEINSTGKGGKTSIIPMTIELRAHLLQCRLRYALKTPYVLCSPLNHEKPMKDIRKALKAACAAASVPEIRLHDLRRSFATSVLAATGDITLVQSLLSHSDINITRRHYAHTLKDGLHKGISKLDHYIGGKHE